MSDIPKFNLSLTTKFRTKLFSRVFAGRIGEVLQAPMLAAAVRDLQRAIPRATKDASMETLRLYVGETLTEELCVKLCWQIAGNVEKLRAGIPVRSWSGQQANEWMPLKLMTIRPVRHYDKITNECVFKVLAGSACPLLIVRYMTRGVMAHIARKVGFSRSSGDFPYKHVADLTGVRLLGQFTPELVRDGQPSFREIACPPGMVKWNRETYITVRSRKSPCPERFSHSCAKCAYGVDRCQYAVHPTTYVLGYCEECKNNSAAFLPDDAGMVCVSCSVKQSLRAGSTR